MDQDTMMLYANVIGALSKDLTPGQAKAVAGRLDDLKEKFPEKSSQRFLDSTANGLLSYKRDQEPGMPLSDDILLRLPFPECSRDGQPIGVEVRMADGTLIVSAVVFDDEGLYETAEVWSGPIETMADHV